MTNQPIWALNDRKAYYATLAGITAIYFIAGKLGLQLAFINASTSAVWAPSGIAIAFLLIHGKSIWPGIFLGAFLVNVSTTGSVATSLGIALGNTLEGLTAFYLINRFAEGHDVFDRPKNILRFVVIMSFSAVMSALIGVTSLKLGGYVQLSDIGAVFLTWWLGDTTGGLIFAPLIMRWVKSRARKLPKNQVFEAILLFLILVVLSQIAFNGTPLGGISDYPVGFLLFPVLLWAAFRFGRRLTVTSSFIISIIALWGTFHGQGPFAVLPLHQSLIVLQIFMATISIMSLCVASLVREDFTRKDNGKELLENRVRNLERSLESLRYDAFHDALTGLPNRKALEERFIQAKSVAMRNDKQIALLFLDLDSFKSINDTLGHSTGDSILKKVAGRLTKAIREGDIVARLGGDEFIVILNDIETRENIEGVAKKIMEAISPEFKIQDHATNVTCSIGISVFPKDGENIDTLLRNSDAALYKAKGAGRNRYQFS